MISLMVEDAPVGMRLGRMMTLALVAGVVISAAVLLLTIGIRHNMADAIGTARVLFKIGVTLALAFVASRLVFVIGRPGASLRARALACILPLVMLAAAVLTELVVLPRAEWQQAAIGRNAAFCVMFIPVLALAPLVAFFAALRNGAPDSPGMAGAVAGLASGGIAAAIYAWHCPDDSPLFAALWYTAAIAIVTALGTIAGRRLLRW